jgi:pseudouridine synthase
MAAEKENSSDLERIHVRIAHSGLCSRRKAEELILQGRVSVNGEQIKTVGVKVSPDDEVAVDGEVIRPPTRLLTVLMNKPKGIITTMRDPQGRATITKFLPEMAAVVKPVGRLDKESEGLLLCTSDGELAHRLTHPRYGVEKEYMTVVTGIPDDKAINRLRKGVFIEGGKTAPADVTVIHAEAKAGTTSLRIIIHEGRKRQVRLMCEAVGHPVITLRRVRIGPLKIKGMHPGEVRLLGKKEVDELKKLVGLPVD